MSNDIQKADQIAYRLFTKLTLVVNQARATVESTSSGGSSRPQAKVDKWFNLETPDSDIFRDHLRIYRTVSSSLPPSPSQPTHTPKSPPTPTHLPPFELQVLLSIPELTSNQVLVYQPGAGAGAGTDSSPRVRIEPTPKFVLLESWVLVFDPSPTSSSSSTSAASSSSAGYHYGESDSASTSTSSSTTTSTGGGGCAAGEVAPSTIYKHGITLFRSLFSLLRILPAWKLFKRLRRGNRSAGLGIRLRVRGVEGDRIHEHGILGFETPPTRTHPPLPTTTHTFPSIPHPMGTLTLTTRYLTTPYFHLDEMESVLSSRFLEEGLEGGAEFTPTLAGRGRGMVMGTSPLGSLPIRTSLPMSPPPRQPSSIADKFILPGPVALHARAASLPPRRVSPSNSTSPASTSSHSNSNAVPVTRTTSTSSATAYSTAATATTITTNTTAAPNTTTSTGTGQGAGTATPGTPGSGSGISGGSSSRGHEAATWSRDDASGVGGKQVSGIAARLRKESTGGGRGADLPSSPGPLPIRRPNINPVHPFKASTLSSGSPSIHSPSPSLRQPSPLSSANTGGPSLPSRPFPSTSVAGAGTTTSPTTTTSRMPPSPIGMGSRPSPPQPPFTPSSLGDRRSLASAEGASGSGGGDESPSPKMQGLGLAQAQGPGKKRYSSSFSKRYSVTGGSGSGVGGSGGGGGTGSEGSVGSGGEKKDGAAVGSVGGGSFLSTNTDDDDISEFVQEIDARKPLSGHQRIRSLERDTSEARRRLGGSGRASGDEKPIAGLLSTDEQETRTSTGPMLTSESEVDERLRQMNQAFLESLEGLGGGRRRERRSSSRLGEGDDGSEQSSEPDPQQGRMFTEGSGTGDGGGDGAVMGRGRGQTLPLRPPLNPRSTSTSDVNLGSVQGSDEVLGRLSLDDERRRSRGH